MTRYNNYYVKPTRWQLFLYQYCQLTNIYAKHRLFNIVIFRIYFRFLDCLLGI